MIKLIDLSHSPPASYVFTSSSVLIGSRQMPADPSYFSLPDLFLQDEHLQILWHCSGQVKEYQIINRAQDPFVTLNGLPFGKQPLKSGDLIQIGIKTFQVVIEGTPLPASEKTESLKQQPDVERQEKWSQQELECLLRQVEQLDPIVVEMPEEEAGEDKPEPITPQPEAFVSDPVHEPQGPFPKEYYLHEHDEEQEIHLNPQQDTEQKDEELQFSTFWKTIGKLCLVLVPLLLLALSLFFAWVQRHAHEEEVMASKGAADVAMALIYTQIKHIRPQNQNWSDSEFIKNNLTAVLASGYQGFADFDAHGSFSHCPYMLRIYTNSEITRFLVLAQPAPSLLQWLLPKGTIIVDSSSMEMRKVKDLKSLNRLLVSSNTLDGAHANEITSLIQEGKLIPLNSLTIQNENEGFIPPKALGFIDPVAENLIYNAPRYYCLGEDLIKKSEQFLDDLQPQQDAALVIQEIFALKRLSHLVLYSSGGLHSAVEAQKALSALAPKEKFLIAYLHLNGLGKVSSSHLLMDNTPLETVANEAAFSLQSEIADGRLNPSPGHEEEDLGDSQEQRDRAVQPFLRDDPLIAKLSDIASLRKKLLQSVSSEMISLLKKQAKSSQPNFVEQFLVLQRKIFEINEQLKVNAQQKLKAILQESNLIPAANLVQYIKDLDLENDFEDFLVYLRGKKSYTDAELVQQLVHQELQNIFTCSNWQELDYSTERLNKLLQFENIPYIDPLIQRQQMMKSVMINKLNEFFYSTDRRLAEVQYLKHNKEMLVKILQHAWIDDYAIAERYLNEFDKRSINIREIAD